MCAKVESQKAAKTVLKRQILDVELKVARLKSICEQCSIFIANLRRANNTQPESYNALPLSLTGYEVCKADITKYSPPDKKHKTSLLTLQLNPNV